MDFNKKIKELRLKNGLNKVEMAKKIGVSEGTIRMWENGTNEPRMGMIEKISTIFGVSKNWLIGYGEEVTPTDDEVDINFYGKVSAGNFEQVSIEDGTLKVPRSVFKGVNPEECFGLKVNGDSMNKVLANDSFIVVHDYRFGHSPEIKTSDIMVIRNGGSHTIKRVRLTETKVHFEPDSYIDEFKTDTYDLDFSDDIEVIGRVIYNYRVF
ncbi:XRE family transcriptional regulator [Salinicoccus roseus]|uniref:XRE family transcriptional regulator n=1 Tax=Salinicoccus roseus TaxID=45670 RepID=UPI002301114F|nr:XRE family transcriptional regulator [Salinicoccus roseus]